MTLAGGNKTRQILVVHSQIIKAGEDCSKNSYVLPLKPKEFSPTHQAGFFCQNALGRGSQVIFYSNIGLHLLGSGQQLDCNKKKYKSLQLLLNFFLPFIWCNSRERAIWTRLLGSGSVSCSVCTALGTGESCETDSCSLPY